ncbi:hypothetical protein Agub_g9857, partial [Astrephomene gubernaculifera]
GLQAATASGRVYYVTKNPTYLSGSSQCSSGGGSSGGQQEAPAAPNGTFRNEAETAVAALAAAAAVTAGFTTQPGHLGSQADSEPLATRVGGLSDGGAAVTSPSALAVGGCNGAASGHAKSAPGGLP